jgi:Protein of unknown function (DUF2891)
VSDWDTFVAGRDDLLRTFATVIATSVTRFDTGHPAFHGCFDWHSAVHGTYALLAASRLTGDSSFAETALAQTGPVAVAAEVAALAGGQLDHEIPYGLAWLLILDAEAARSDVEVFGALATSARDRLVAHLDGLAGDGTLTAAAADEEYPNAIWPTIALRRWGLALGDASAVDTADRAAGPILRAFFGGGEGGGGEGGGGEPAAPMAGRGFFSPVHMAVLLAADVGGGANVAEVLAGAGFPADVLTAAQEPTVHSAGLNFSRAWGLYGAWRMTGEPRWRDAMARLIRGHAVRPERWHDDYARYAHWVPQFGVFAVAETVDHA